MLQLPTLRVLCGGMLLLWIAIPIPVTAEPSPEPSIARQWNEELLDAIRHDYARPTVHARNLFHTSIAMWDAWAAYDPLAVNYLHPEKSTALDVRAARRETLSHAVHRILASRFAHSPGAPVTLAALDARMAALGYDPSDTDTQGDSPSALGNRIALAVLAFGASDGSNEANGYQNRFYAPSNPALLPALPGNPSILDPNRWQPLVLDFFVDQSGNPLPNGSQPFLGPEWGSVTPFALSPDDLSVYVRDGHEYRVYHDPGPPPRIGGEGDAAYRFGFQQVLEWSAQLDPSDGVLLDIGPGARGNNTLGTNDGHGRSVNPKTGQPYAANIVPAGDYYRVLAEFWADGPDSETPPGHWFTIANRVSDDPAIEKRIGGIGPLVDDLEWDVKLYLALAGAMHDSAISAWGVKGWYDYVRPISAIRYMVSRGQSSDPDLPYYDPNGIALVPGRVEQLTPESVQPGERHAHLAGRFNVNVGKIAARAWRGPDYVDDPETTTAGVGWILVENWWPYQRPTFVTPPFAGYVSGHSTFSRAAAELLTLFTGDAYFPGGIGEFVAPRNAFLVFEDGPSVDVTLQWATYRDAADETSISRIYGGIHPTADDIPGRLMGAVIGPDAYRLASTHWGPWRSLDVGRVSISRHGLLIASGTLHVGVYGDTDRFDPLQETRVHASGSAGPLFESEDFVCETAATQRGATRCRDGSGSWLVWHRRHDGDVRFLVVGHGNAPGADVDGPVVLEISTGDQHRAGLARHCRRWGGRLHCRNGPAAQKAVETHSARPAHARAAPKSRHGHRTADHVARRSGR